MSPGSEKIEELRSRKYSPCLRKVRDRRKVLSPDVATKELVLFSFKHASNFILREYCIALNFHFLDREWNALYYCIGDLEPFLVVA